MQHTVEERSASSEVGTPPPVWLRLIRGASAQPVCMLNSDETLTVGASETAGWRVDGREVPAAALQLRVLAGCLFARAEGECEVWIDGQQLASMWVPVDKGARLQVGEALIEVGLSGRSRAAQSQRLGASLGAEVALDEAADSLLARFSITDIAGPALAGALCDGTCAATVLDPTAIERTTPAFRPASFLIAGSLVACAYGCWVLLLDYF